MASTPNRTQIYRPAPSPRDYVSPLGGQCAPMANNLQLKQERLNRAQSPRPPSSQSSHAASPELKPRNGNGPRPRG
jgi:hypothetical protein